MYNRCGISCGFPWRITDAGDPWSCDLTSKSYFFLETSQGQESRKPGDLDLDLDTPASCALTSHVVT